MVAIDRTLPRSTCHHAWFSTAVCVTEPAAQLPLVLPSTARSAVPPQAVLDCVAVLFNAKFVPGTSRFKLRLPVAAPAGSILIVYVPVVGSVCVARLKLLLLDVLDVSCEPSGLRSVTVTVPRGLLVIWTVICCVAVPENVNCPF